MNPDIATIVISDTQKQESVHGTKQVDEVIVKPISPENLADKVLMLIAKRELKRSRIRES